MSVIAICGGYRATHGFDKSPSDRQTKTGTASFPFSSIRTPAFLFRIIAGSATQTVFDGFTLEQRQRAAEAGWDRAAAVYASTLVTALQNVADALQTAELDGDALRAAIAAAPPIRA